MVNEKENLIRRCRSYSDASRTLRLLSYGGTRYVEYDGEATER